LKRGTNKEIGPKDIFEMASNNTTRNRVMEDIEMGRRLEGKTAVITGGTSGIGEASAEVFAAEGAKVIIAGRSEEKGQKIADRLGANVFYKRTDVTNEDDIKAMIDFAVEKFGTIDCLFNNAGGLSRGDLETVTPDDFDYSMRLLLGSVVFGIKHAASIMKKNKSGCIINNSSIAALRNKQVSTCTVRPRPLSPT
jgi:NAD(P)-dependent dehydrogenase (short-subunit alcohol dehydrogenase family)